MTNQKALFHWILTVTLLVFIVFLSACKTSTEPEPEPEPEPTPIERVGTKEFTLTIIHRDTEAELTDYDIEVDGPVTASESGVSSAQFTLEDVVSGEYTITVSKDGFIESEVTEELEVPSEVSADFLAEATISLREQTPPVEVNNAEDNTVTTGKADEEDAEEDEAVTLQIPANTFPPSAVKPDGTVDISVTRAKPSQAQQSAEGLVSESIVLTPAVDLNNPVTIAIPIRDIEGLENAEYVLQPGNIPLTPDGNGNLVATLTPDRSTLGPVANIHFFWNAIVNTFRIYNVTLPSFSLEATDGFSAFRDLSGPCGGPLNVDYSIPGVAVPATVRHFGGDFARFSENRSVNIAADAIGNRVVTIRARNATRTFRVLLGDDEVSSVTVNRALVETTDAIHIACHNSGGG